MSARVRVRGCAAICTGVVYWRRIYWERPGERPGEGANVRCLAYFTLHSSLGAPMLAPVLCFSYLAGGGVYRIVHHLLYTFTDISHKIDVKSQYVSATTNIMRQQTCARASM